MEKRGVYSLLTFNSSLCGGKARDGHAEGGAAHIVQAHAVAELDARRVAAVLAADAQAQVGTGLTCLLYTSDAADEL